MFSPAPALRAGPAPRTLVSVGAHSSVAATCECTHIGIPMKKPLPVDTRTIFESGKARDTFAEIASAGFASLGVDAIQSIASLPWATVIGRATEEVLRAWFGQISVALLKLLIQSSDEVVVKLDQLARQPIHAGLEMAKAAVELDAQTRAEIKFRNKRLHAALDELERGRATLPKTPENGDLQIQLAITQAICASMASGGQRYAMKKWQDAQYLLCEKAIDLRRSALRHRTEAFKSLWHQDRHLIEWSRKLGHSALASYHRAENSRNSALRNFQAAEDFESRATEASALLHAITAYVAF